MKRTMMLALILLFISVSLFACTSVNTKNKISDYRWQIESVSDLDGSPLENEMDLVFNNDSSFALKDRSNGDEWKGKYTTEKVDSSYKLDLFFEGKEEVITGVYGTREYKDKTRVASVIFQVDDKILSFIGKK